MRIVWSMLAGLALACGGSGAGELEVTVRTDFAPLTDFVRVDSSLFGPGESQPWSVTVMPTDNYIAGHPVAEWRALPAGDYQLQVVLVAPTGGALAMRQQSVRVQGFTPISIPITRGDIAIDGGGIDAGELPDAGEVLDGSPPSDVGGTDSTVIPPGDTGSMCGATSCASLDSECTVGVCVSGRCESQNRPACTPCSAGACVLGSCMAEIPEITFDFEGGFPASWETVGDAMWRTDTNAHRGSRALRSGVIGHDESSIVRVTLDLPVASEISFWARTQSQSDDLLTFEVSYMGGGGRNMLGGLAPWMEFTSRTNRGALTTLTWTYAKDGSGTQGDDAAWIDDVTIRPMEQCD